MMSYTASVMENASIGTTVLNVNAQPAEAPPPLCSSLITYSIMPSMLTQFSIQSNGTIVIQEHLDFETQQFHVFQVVAQDGCSQTIAEVNITILNVNDSAPLCLYHIMYLSISESTPPSNTSFSLHCTDPDDFESAIVYNITTGNDEEIFDISSDGYLSTLMQLDYELITQHLLLIHVTKITYPSVVTKVTVIVTVLASNEFPPVFSSSVELSYDVDELLPVGSIIANIIAEDDDDGTDGIVTYSLSTAQDCFTIDPVSGSLALLCVLDREMRDVYYITVLAKDNPINNNLQRSTNITTELNVLDRNDNIPQFLQSVYTLGVLETVSNTVLLTLHCSDSDEGDNITYHIVDGNSLEHFSVDPTSGNLFVGSHLNYESQQFYHLKVQCSDGGDQPLSSTASVVIQVVNVDEYDPVIELHHTGLYWVAEDSPVGSVIVTVSATDTDSGLAGEIVYSINRTNFDLYCPEELFEIEPTLGSLYLLATLDKELELPFFPPVYQCPLIVSNHLPDGRQATDILRLSVSNVNDVVPVCDQYVIIIEILEDFVVGNSVCSFTCHDDDSPTLAYNIANPLTPFIVTHNSTHVLIRLSSQLDYEAQTHYSFEVVISDVGMPPLTTTVAVHVNIKDVNEHAPVFVTVSDSIRIPEDTRVGTLLYTFSANDNDRHSDLHYTIIEGNDLVVLNEVTGLLYLAASLDHETMHQLYLTVQAEDVDPVNPLTATAFLNVSISDINDNIPVFSSVVYLVSLVETVMIGTSFDLPVCSDEDEGVNSLLSCHISSMCSYAYGGSCVTVNPSPFSFNFTTGEGIVTSMLDYEVATLYVFEVLCTDQGNPQLSASAVINVEIVSVNEFTPSFDLLASYNITVAEDVVIGSSIATLAALDLDSGLDGELTYSLSSDHFAIDPNTGVLFVTQYLDREQEMSYTLQVIASDNSPNINNSAQVNVYVMVNDVNDNSPQCEQDIVTIKLSEYITVWSTIVQLNCSDADQPSTLHYTIVSGNEEGSFSVYNNGSVVLSSLLNMSEYHLAVSVADSSTPQLSVTVNCYIHVDKENQPPVFDVIQPYNISLPLSTLPGSLLFMVTASDVGDVISYSIFPSNSFLNIDQWSGSIYLISSLQKGQTGSHLFTLTAIDTAELSSMLNLTVEVIDDIYYSVRFNQSLYFVSIAEDADVNSAILTVYCTNNYSEHIDNIQYSLAEPNSLFHITQSTGLLTITGSLDYELDDNHNVSVLCVDPTAQSLYSTAVVMVTVLPINEHTPILTFDTMEVTIMENGVIGQRILQVSATDHDRNSELNYYLSRNFSPFYLDPISGVLYLIQSLDYESQVSYNMLVTVVDEAAHSSDGNIIIHVLDANDNSPYCNPSFLSIVVPDDVMVGQSVAMLNCNDHDAGINSLLQFSLIHNNSDVLDINESTGEIFVAHELNASASLYFLIILVSDRGSPVLNFTVAVQISIQQLPDDSLNDTITEYDEAKNNSLTVNFSHLTLEQVSDAITCTYAITLYVFAVAKWSKREIFECHCQSCYIFLCSKFLVLFVRAILCQVRFMI